MRPEVDNHDDSDHANAGDDTGWLGAMLDQHIKSLDAMHTEAVAARKRLEQ